MAYVDISMSDFEDDDIIDELQDRGYLVIRGDLGDVDELKELYKDYKTYGFTEKFQALLEAFFEEM
jgi:hypothetical protein